MLENHCQRHQWFAMQAFIEQFAVGFAVLGTAGKHFFNRRDTGRAFVQAQKFGAQFVIPLEVARLDCGGGLERPMTLEMTDGWKVQAKTVVIASGARYRNGIGVARQAELR